MKYGNFRGYDRSVGRAVVCESTSRRFEPRTPLLLIPIFVQLFMIHMYLYYISNVNFSISDIFLQLTLYFHFCLFLAHHSWISEYWSKSKPITTLYNTFRRTSETGFQKTPNRNFFPPHYCTFFFKFNKNSLYLNLTLGLFFLWPQRRATSSGSTSLNSQPSPVHLIQLWQSLCVSNSSRNCHNCTGPDPEIQAAALFILSYSFR